MCEKEMLSASSVLGFLFLFVSIFTPVKSISGSAVLNKYTVILTPSGQWRLACVLWWHHPFTANLSSATYGGVTLSQCSFAYFWTTVPMFFLPWCHRNTIKVIVMLLGKLKVKVTSERLCSVPFQKKIGPLIHRPSVFTEASYSLKK